MTGGVRCKIMSSREKVAAWSHVQIFVQLFICESMGILIDTSCRPNNKNMYQTSGSTRE